MASVNRARRSCRVVWLSDILRTVSLSSINLCPVPQVAISWAATVIGVTVLWLGGWLPITGVFGSIAEGYHRVVDVNRCGSARHELTGVADAPHRGGKQLCVLSALELPSSGEVSLCARAYCTGMGWIASHHQRRQCDNVQPTAPLTRMWGVFEMERK